MRRRRAYVGAALPGPLAIARRAPKASQCATWEGRFICRSYCVSSGGFPPLSHPPPRCALRLTRAAFQDSNGGLARSLLFDGGSSERQCAGRNEKEFRVKLIHYARGARLRASVRRRFHESAMHECTFVVSRIRHARNRGRAGLRKAIVRQRGGPEAPRVSLSSASFRFRCRSDSDTFSAPTPFRPRRLSDSDAVPTPMSFRLRRLFGSDVFMAPTPFRLRHLFGSSVFPTRQRRVI